MIRKYTFAILCAILLTVPATRSLAADKHVGIGFVLGEPTGADVKFWLANERALEFGAAWSLSGNNEFHVQGDYLFHKYGLFHLTNADELPLFFGVGARMILVEDFDDVFGIRFPVGLSYIFANYPFDIFGEIVPILDVAPDSHFDMEGAVGARFWF